MEKYATYNVFVNKDTGEVKKVLINDQNEMTKIASLSDWKQLEFDPDTLVDKDETSSDNEEG